MTKEADAIADAFYMGRRLTKARTVCHGEDVYLFGSRIAWREESGAVYVTLAGYGSRTTRDRVNAILTRYDAPFRIRQINFDQHVHELDTGALTWVSSHEQIPIGGPLTMLAWEAERRAATTTVG